MMSMTFDMDVFFFDSVAWNMFLYEHGPKRLAAGETNAQMAARIEEECDASVSDDPPWNEIYEMIERLKVT